MATMSLFCVWVCFPSLRNPSHHFSEAVTALWSPTPPIPPPQALSFSVGVAGGGPGSPGVSNCLGLDGGAVLTLLRAPARVHKLVKSLRTPEGVGGLVEEQSLMINPALRPRRGSIRAQCTAAAVTVFLRAV